MNVSDLSALEISVQEGLTLLREAELPEQARFALDYLVPEGMTPVVELYADQHQRLSDAAAWNPEVGEVHVSFKTFPTPETQATKEREPQPLANATLMAETHIRFQPIAVRGEPVSATLLRDRGPV